MTTLLHSYLFAWLFVLGLSLGSLANLMVQSLTGGRWVEPVRPAWIAAARVLPLVALLFLPIAFGVRWIYPWTEAPGHWLNVPFFIVRSAAYLVVWCLLAAAFLRAERGNIEPAAGGGRTSRAWSAAGLIVYTFTISFAAFDWIASLTPAWYSSGFGLVVGTGQMLSASAFGIMAAALVAPAQPDRELRQRFHDLGNLLLMYVLVWAYLAFTQFLVIWSENIPTEIHWYVRRLETGWVALAWIVVALHFALPFAILLSRDAKRSPRLLGSIAAGLLGVHLVQVYWMVVPSVRPEGFSLAWSDVLVLLLLALLGALAWRRARPAMAPGVVSHG
jgi:hypothetical protein